MTPLLILDSNIKLSTFFYTHKKKYLIVIVYVKNIRRCFVQSVLLPHINKFIWVFIFYFFYIHREDRANGWQLMQQQSSIPLWLIHEGICQKAQPAGKKYFKLEVNNLNIDLQITYKQKASQDTIILLEHKPYGSTKSQLW